jgi:DNA-binding CsgD family transcriptional regulator
LYYSGLVKLSREEEILLDTKLNSLVSAEPKEISDGIELPLNEIELQLAQMISMGKTTDYMAEQLNKSVHWVRTHKKDKRIIGLVNTLHYEAVEVARAKIVSSTGKAAETIVDLIDKGPAPVRLAAAKDVLDRIGLKAPDKKQIETTVTVNNIPKEERLAAIKERALRLGLIPDDIIEIEGKEINEPNQQ